MNYNLFYEKCQQLPENERKWVDAFYNTIIETFNNNTQFEDPNKICKLFYGKSLALSKAQYYRKRKLVRIFYDWLKEQGAVDDNTVKYVYSLQLKDVVSEYELSKNYFKDLDEVLDLVKLVGSNVGMSDSNDMLNFKAIVILAWYGVESSEMIKIRKSDLCRNSQTIIVGNRTLYIKKEYFDTLCKFADIDVHKGFPSKKKQVYLSSPFLMRSSKQINMTLNAMQKALQRFNTFAQDSGKKLSILNLRRNGIFRAIYQSNDEKTVNTLVQELTGCDRPFAFGYKEFYERWKEIILR